MPQEVSPEEMQRFYGIDLAYKDDETMMVEARKVGDHIFIDEICAYKDTFHD